MSIDLHKLLCFAAENNASDVHVQADAAPMLRIGGQLRTVDSGPLSEEEVLAFIASMAPKHDGDLAAQLVAGLDFSHVVPGVTGCFRCSAFRQLGKPAIVMRVIRLVVPSIEDLHLPKVLRDIALSRRGLTLLTGTTGSGKSRAWRP